MSSSVMTGPWGQPVGEYIFMPGTVFEFSLTIPLAQKGGFKLHVSVHPEDADPLARLALPTLRLLHVHHKVVRNRELYERMNRGAQRGKFITIYPGPAAKAQAVVDALEPGIARHGFRPGPPPTTRQSRHTTYEIRIGRSGLISCYWCEDYEND